MRSRVSSAVIACVAIGSTALAMTTFGGPALAAGHTAKVKLIKVSKDPYSGDGAQHATEAEPDTLACGKTIVSAFQVGRYGDGGASNTGWATSTDGGTSWKHGFLP